MARYHLKVQELDIQAELKSLAGWEGQSSWYLITAMTPAITHTFSLEEAPGPFLFFYEPGLSITLK